MMPVSYEQPLYNELYVPHQDVHSNGRMMPTSAPRIGLPNVYLMSPDQDQQPATDAGSQRVDDCLHTYDNMSSR